MNRVTKLYLIVTLLVVPLFVQPTIAQDTTVPIQCGDIKSGEVISVGGSVQVNDYELELRQNGTALEITVQPDFASLNSTFWLIDPNGVQLLAIGNGNLGEPDSTDTQQLQAGVYTISVTGHAYQTTGTYKLSVGCTLPNGRIVEPGDPAVGFPGLPTIDFRGITESELISPIEGVISPPGSDILGYTFAGNEGEPFNLNVTHIAGDLSLAVMLMTQDNEIAYATTLFPNQSINTTYTLGVSRFDRMQNRPTEDTIFYIDVTP